jgi:hypothetical protein
MEHEDIARELGRFSTAIENFTKEIMQLKTDLKTLVDAFVKQAEKNAATEAKADACSTRINTIWGVLGIVVGSLIATYWSLLHKFVK